MLLQGKRIVVTGASGALGQATVARARAHGAEVIPLCRRAATADMEVDVQSMLSASADLDPVTANQPDKWPLRALDKAGVIGGAMTEEEAEAAEDERRRADIEELLALVGSKSGEASGCNH